MFGWSRCLNKKQDFSNPFNRIKYMFYGSHAYLVFNCAFDKLIAYLQNKNFPVADSDAFLIYDNAYVVNRPFFIQYCEKSSINSKNYGYIYYGSHSKPPENFKCIDELWTLYQKQ